MFDVVTRTAYGLRALKVIVHVQLCYFGARAQVLEPFIVGLARDLDIRAIAVELEMRSRRTLQPHGASAFLS